MSHQLTSLQTSVLKKYERLAESLQNLDNSIKNLKQNKSDDNVSTDELLQEMRNIELKIGLIGTLLKGSVYSYILQRKNDQAILNSRTETNDYYDNDDNNNDNNNNKDNDNIVKGAKSKNKETND